MAITPVDIKQHWERLKADYYEDQIDVLVRLLSPGTLANILVDMEAPIEEAMAAHDEEYVQAIIDFAGRLPDGHPMKIVVENL